MKGFRFTIIQNTMGNKQDFVELGLFCARVCEALDRGLGGKDSANLSKPVHAAIEQLRKWVEPTIRTLIAVGLPRSESQNYR